MNENMAIYEKVRNVPQEALKPINGGRLKGMSDINPMWRIKMLTEVFGMCGIGWKVEITDKRLEPGSGNEIVCFVDINIYVKVDGEWSAPIPGMGGSSFVAQEAKGPFTSDECFKMAYTDAISVACKSLGFAADVYFANDRTKYSNQETQETAQKPPQSASQGTPYQPTPQKIPHDTGRTSVPHSYKREAYNLREQHFMTWNDLQALAERVLDKKLGKVTQIQDEQEWKLIVAELKKYDQQPAVNQ